MFQMCEAMRLAFALWQAMLFDIIFHGAARFCPQLLECPNRFNRFSFGPGGMLSTKVTMSCFRFLEDTCRPVLYESEAHIYVYASKAGPTLDACWTGKIPW